MSKWPIFICYRQSDGKAVARRTHDLLHGHTVTSVDPESGATVSYELDVYFDQAAPAAGDWTEIHEPYLKRARAFIVVCTPGAKLKESNGDWVHQEIDWWLENSQSAPVLIDALGEEARYVPDAIASRWPNAQRVRLVEDEWSRLGEDELKIEEARVQERLIGGITSTAEHYLRRELEEKERQARTLQTALERQKMLSGRFKVAFFIATLFLILAAGTTWYAFDQQGQTQRALMSEQEAKADAEAARDKAKSALDTANEQRELAEEQRDLADAQSDHNKSLLLSSQSRDLVGVNDQRALLLAVEAVLSTSNQSYVTPEARSALQNAVVRVTGIGLPGHTDTIDVADFSADESYLATGSVDPSVSQRNEVRVWDISDPQAPILAHILESRGSLRSIYFDQVGKHVLTVQSKYMPNPGLMDRSSEALVWTLSDDLRYSVARPLFASSFNVYNIVKSNKSDLLAVSNSVGEISIVSLSDLTETKTLRRLQPPFADRILRLVFSNDDKILLGCTDRSYVWLWNLESSSVLPVTVVHANHRADRPVSPVVGVDICGISNDRSLLFTGSSDWFDNSTWADLDLKLWKLDKLEPVGEPVHLTHDGASNSSAIEMASFSRDHKTLFSTSADGWVRVWDISNTDAHLTAVKSGEYKSGRFTSEIITSPDLSVLTFEAGNEVVLLRLDDLRKPASKAIVRSLQGFDARVERLLYSPSGRLLFASSLGGGARLWDLQRIDQASGPRGLGPSTYEPALKIDLVSEGRLVVALRETSVEFRDVSDPFAPNALRIWPLNESQAKSFLDCLSCRVVVAPDLTWAAIQGDKENESDIVELKESGRVFKVPSRLWREEIEFSADGRWLYVDEGKRETVFDLKTPAPDVPKAKIFKRADGSYSRDTSDFGPFVLHRRFVNEYHDRIGRSEIVGTLWSLDEQNGPVPRIEIDGFARGIGRSAFSPNGRWLALAGKSAYPQRSSDDTIVRLLRLGDPEIKTFDLEGHEFTPGLRFSGDGRWLLAASSDILLGGKVSRARLWRLNKEGVEKPKAFVLPGVDSFLHSVAFSPDGRFLLTINGGGPTARLWRLDGSEPELASVLSIPRQTYNWHWDIRFDSNSTVLVIANTDNPTPYLWRLDQPTIPARGIAIRNGDRGVKSIQFVDDDSKLLIGNSGGTYDGLSGTTGSHATIVNLETFPSPGSTFRTIDSSEGMSAVAYRPEVGLLYSDGKVLKVQSIDIEATVARAKRALGRNLTLDEWDRVGLGEVYRPTFPDLKVESKTLQSLVGVVDRLRAEDPEAAAELSTNIVEWTVSLNEASICNEIGWGLALIGDGENALKAVSCALNHFPEKPNYRDTRGVAMALLGRKEEAIDDLGFAAKAWATDPSQAEIVSKRRHWIAELEAGRDPF